MSPRLVNFVAFQAVWFASLLGATRGRPEIGLLVLAGALVVHAALRRHRWRGDLVLLAVAGLAGYLADSALTLAGVIGFPPEAAWGGPSPLWMVGLWVNFATTLRLSLAWLVPRPGLAATLGLVAGPIAYGAGARMGAIELPAGVAAGLLAVAAEYAIALPLLGWVAARTTPDAPRPANAAATEVVT
ncbi:MAG: DUF2878 domain-containing protein [Phycisphaerales bacterium]|nr:DUF2878 domain-containing protein [Phycisphaerales bacterium]